MLGKVSLEVVTFFNTVLPDLRQSSSLKFQENTNLLGILG